jgi:hypothetical protein
MEVMILNLDNLLQEQLDDTKFQPLKNQPLGKVEPNLFFNPFQPLENAGFAPLF